MRSQPGKNIWMMGGGEIITSFQDEGEIDEFARWPECRSHLSWPGITYFVVRPKWIRYTDFDQNPPFIEEFTFETSRSGTRHIL